MDFLNSKTCQNLMRAFAGESQARNRYTIAAQVAGKQQLYVVEQTFLFTAKQEKEHAEIFYQQLVKAAGQNIHIDGAYPVDLSENVSELLHMAAHNEFEESDDVYVSFAQTAQEEGYLAAASAFSQIAKIEKIHGERFERFAKHLEEGTLFASDKVERWFCLNCGHVYEREKALERCPVCGYDKGYFIRSDFKPFV